MHSCSTTEFRKFLTENTTIIEKEIGKQRLEILESLNIRNKRPKLNKINFETRANIFKCL